MKTPEEIKRGLELAKTNCLYVEHCEGICPYNKNCDVSDPDAMTEIPREMVSDALAYIQQLERENAQKEERIKQLERERDAVVYYYIAKKKECRTCKHFGHKASDEPCRSCGIGQSHWEWRGVEEGDHGKEEL